MTVCIDALYKAGSHFLIEKGIPEASEDAWILLEAITGIGRTAYYRDPKAEVDEGKVHLYRQWLERRAMREPVQYITGSMNFAGFDFLVTPEVLIPRLDTEVLVETALPYVKKGTRILDLCTGSGCILLSLLGLRAQTSPESGQTDSEDEWICAGTDIAQTSLAVAAENERRIRQAVSEASCFPRISWLVSDLMAENPADLEGAPFDMITANPPYIPTEVVEGLDPEVRGFEPRRALDGGQDGLIFYRRIAGMAGGALRAGGHLFMEIGYDQGETVPMLFEAAGFTEVQLIRDLAGHPRVVSAVWPG